GASCAAGCYVLALTTKLKREELSAANEVAPDLLTATSRIHKLLGTCGGDADRRVLDHEATGSGRPEEVCTD
ncbi:MAG: hypothetical protein ACRDLT_17690, partial [Solirubrobacteraceae bacterium]